MRSGRSSIGKEVVLIWILLGLSGDFVGVFKANSLLAITPIFNPNSRFTWSWPSISGRPMSLMRKGVAPIRDAGIGPFKFVTILEFKYPLVWNSSKSAKAKRLSPTIKISLSALANSSWLGAEVFRHEMVFSSGSKRSIATCCAKSGQSCGP